MTKASTSGRDKAVADDFLAGHGRCAFCGVTAEVETLSRNGARCDPCFDAYRSQCRSPQPMPTPDERREILERLRTSLTAAGTPGKAWAYRLQEREHRGETLSVAQRTNWRRALGVRDELSGTESAPLFSAQASRTDEEAAW